MRREEDAITSRIRAFIAGRFPAARSRTLTQDDKLLENGILDSLGVLDLVAYLEEEFAIRVTDEDLVPEHFESLDRLTAFVSSRQSPGRG